MSKWLAHKRFVGGMIPYRLEARCLDGSYPYELYGGGESWAEAEEGLIRNIKEIAHSSKVIEVENE